MDVYKKNDGHILQYLTLLEEDMVDPKLEEIANLKKPVIIGFLNQHAYNLTFKDVSICTHFKNIDYLFRDGKGVELACYFHNLNPKSNLNGTDLIPQLITKLKNSSKRINFFAYGTEEPWLSQGSEHLFAGNAHTLDGFKSDDTYLAHYNKHKGDVDSFNVIVLAMGMPKQERIATLLKQKARGHTIIVCGGAILDFQAGKFTRSPVFFRQVGLEWLYRLVCEPKRLFKRYVFGIPIFFWNVFKSKHFRFNN